MYTEVNNVILDEHPFGANAAVGKFPFAINCVNFSSIKKIQQKKSRKIIVNLAWILTQYTLEVKYSYLLCIRRSKSLSSLFVLRIHKYINTNGLNLSHEINASSLSSVFRLFLINKIQDLDFEYVGNLYHILNTRSMLPTYIGSLLYTHIMYTFSKVISFQVFNKQRIMFCNKDKSQWEFLLK